MVDGDTWERNVAMGLNMRFISVSHRKESLLTVLSLVFKAAVSVC